MSDKRRRNGPDTRKKAKTPEANIPGAGAAACPAGGNPYLRRALWSAAFVLVLCGYALLLKAAPGGQNAWSIVSPALLLAGYLLFIPAIISTYRR